MKENPMKVSFIQAEASHIQDCVLSLQKSELGSIYFSDEEKAIEAVSEGISKREIYAALTDEKTCVGFLWVIKNGAFHSFPYLHVIAVKEEFRGKGIGKIMMKYFEQNLSDKRSKVFLVVADFNPRAKKFYEDLGYSQVGSIPNLYRNGISEYLMMKELM